MPSPLVQQSQLRSTETREYAFDRAFPVGATVWASPDAGSGGEATASELAAAENRAPNSETSVPSPPAERKTELAKPVFAAGQVQPAQPEHAQAETEAMPDLALVMAAEGTALLAPSGSRESGATDGNIAKTSQTVPEAAGLATAIPVGDPAMPDQGSGKMAPSVPEPAEVPSARNETAKVPDARPAVPVATLELGRPPHEPLRVLGMSARRFAAAGDGIDLVANAHMRGIEVGPLPLHKGGNGEVTVRLRDVVDLIQPMIEWSEYVRLSRSKNSDRFVSLEKLRLAGIDAQYDAARREISLNAL
jgi:hypothetical protein